MANDLGPNQNKCLISHLLMDNDAIQLSDRIVSLHFVTILSENLSNNISQLFYCKIH